MDQLNISDLLSESEIEGIRKNINNIFNEDQEKLKSFIFNLKNKDILRILVKRENKLLVELKNGTQYLIHCNDEENRLNLINKLLDNSLCDKENDIMFSEKDLDNRMNEQFKNIPRSERRRLDNEVRKMLKKAVKKNEKQSAVPVKQKPIVTKTTPPYLTESEEALEKIDLQIEKDLLNLRSIKGVKDGVCNIETCDNKPAVYYNFSTRRWYCQECAIKLNVANMDDALNMFGHELCIHKDKLGIMSTGSRALDHTLGEGIPPGDMTVFRGRPHPEPIVEKEE